MIRILAFITCMLLAASARADGLRLAIGSGFTSAGSVAGGLTLSPSAGYSWYLGDTAVSVADEVNVTGLTYDAPGFVNNALVGWGYASSSWGLEASAGPTVLSTILCGTRYDRRWNPSTFCNRVIGVAGSARVQGTWYPDRAPLGVFANVSGTWIPDGAVFGGPLIQVSIGSILRMSRPDKR